MSSDLIFYGIADLLQWTFGIFEIIGDKFNWLVIAGGFAGLFYWLNVQHKFNQEAKNNPTKIK